MIKKISFVSIIIIVVSILKYLDPNSFPLSHISSNKNIWFYFIDWIFLILFIVILYFFFTYSKWKEKTRKSNISAVIAYCCLNAFLALSFATVGSNQKGPERYRYKNCWNNLKVINTAIDNYIMDSSEMMTSEIDFDKLVKGKYLESIPKGSEETCYYKISEDGLVYCVKHKYPGLKIFNDGQISFIDLDLEKELKDKPQLFTDDEKKFILESNKELENRVKEIENKNKLTVNKFSVLVLSLPLIFLFFPSVVLRK